MIYLREAEESNSQVAFIVRTYSGHFSARKIFNIFRMLDSLIALQNPVWVAYLVNTDTSRLPALPDKYRHDSRIRIMNNIKVTKRYDEWVAGYDVTDEAISRLESDFVWFVVTNGDNTYEPEFLNNLPSGFDLIMVDYWSRYERGGETLNPLNMSSSKCHVARLELGFIDLGGAIISLEKFRQNSLKFMAAGEINAQDGLVFMEIADSNWRVNHVQKCLFSHSPNPYACYLLGGAWFESGASRKEIGDACWNPEELTGAKVSKNLKYEISDSGILFWKLQDHDHAIKMRQKDQKQFEHKLSLRLKDLRSEYCKRLKATGFVLPVQSYLKYNPDLHILKDTDEVESHFWIHGCLETRKFENIPKGYLYAKEKA